MAAGYNFAFNMSLQAPPSSDINQVRKTIEAGLKNIKVQFDTKGAKKAASAIGDVGKASEGASKKAEGFADVITMKGRSFAAYTVASAAIIKLTGALTNATREAFKLEKELAKIAQVTRMSNKEVNQQASVILNISKNYGVAATKVGELVRMLAQTGMSFQEAAKGAEILARTELLASFENLGKTTEGLIALMSGFNLSTRDAAKGLESINVVAKNFAVESGDIVEAIKRTGGAFAAANGNINELIAMFTAVRSTSRESAETIATAFRTIFGRLQRPKTIEYFKELNIELADAAGNFVGPMEAINRITEGLEKAGIAAGSIRFAEVVEQIGGIRQYSKVVPLLTQNAKAQRALADANNAASESDADVIKAKQTLSQQIAELTANFRALIYEITQTESFKLIATIFISAANAAIELTRALKPLIPLLMVVAGLKIGKAFSGAFGAMKAGKLGGMNRGGIVPGQGSGDTVPAMLTPGEFVIRKSAVQAFGAGNLSNINKYATGGTIKTKDTIGFVTAKKGELPNDNLNAGKDMRLAALRKKGISPRGTKDMDGRNKVRLDIPYRKLAIAPSSGEGFVGERVTKNALSGIDNFLNTTKTIPQGKAKSTISGSSDAQSSLNGYVFEEIVKKYSGIAAAGGKKPFDFVGGAPLGGSLENDPTPEFLDAARTGKTATDIRKKTLNAIKEQGLEYTSSGFIGTGKGKKTQTAKRKARGGGIHGTDTVPALLTPGEFVINQKSAKAFGYGKLGKINKYAAGGRVQRFATGGEMLGPGRGEAAGFGADFSNTLREWGSSLGKSEAEIADFAKSLKKADHNMEEVSKSMKQMSQANKAGAKQGADKASRDKIFVHQQERLQKKGGGGVVPIAAPGGKDKDINTKKLNKDLDEAGKKAKGFGSALANINPMMLLFGLQTFAMSAEQFGININKTALETKGSMTAMAAATLYAGKSMGSWSATVAESGAKGMKGFFGKLAGGLAKFIGKIGPLLLLEIGGMVAEMLFTTDFAKQKQQAIELGDAQSAAAAAANQFSQKTISSIPIIGGFINAFSEGLGFSLEGSALEDVFAVEGQKELAMSMASLAASQTKFAEIFSKDIDNIVKALKERPSEGKDPLKQADAAATKAFGNVDTLIAEAQAGGRAVTASLVNRFTDLSASKMFTSWWNKTEIMANAQQGLAMVTESLSRSTEQYEKILLAVTPAMANVTKKFTLGGDSIQAVGTRLKNQFKSEDLQKVISLAFGGEQASAKDLRAQEAARIETAGNFITASKKEMARMMTDPELMGKPLLQQAMVNIEQTAIANREAEIKLAQSRLRSADALVEAQRAAEEYRKELEKTNQAYMEAARSLRAFETELAIFADKVRGFELSKELLDTGLGTAGQKAIEKSLGIDVLKGSFRDIERAGGSAELVSRGTRFAGQTVGQNLEIATSIQSGMDKVLTGGFTGEFAKIRKQAAETGFGSDVKADQKEAIEANVAKFLGKEVFGDISKVPETFKKRFGEFSKEFAKVLAEGGDLSKLQGIADKMVNEVGGESLKLIQGINEKQAQGIQQLGQAYSKLNKMELDFAKQRIEQTRAGQQALNDIEQQRLDHLERLGFNPKAIREERKELAKRRQKEALGRVSGQFGAGRGVKNFKDLQREGEKASKKLEAWKIRNADKSTKVEFDSAKGNAKAREREIADREKLRANIQNQIAAAKDFMAARKEEIDLIIQETHARRENIKQFRDAVGDLLIDFAFGSDEARQDMLEAANLTVAAAQRGSLQGMTGEQRGAVGSFLDRFSGIDMALPAFGGKTAAQMKGDLAAKEAVEMGLIRPQDMAKFASMARKDALPMDKRVENALRSQLNDFYAKQREIQKFINEREKDLVEDQGKDIDKFKESVTKFESAVKKFFDDRSGVKPPKAPPEPPKPPKDEGGTSPRDIPLSEIKEAVEKGATAQKELRDKYFNDRNAQGGPKHLRPESSTIRGHHGREPQPLDPRSGIKQKPLPGVKAPAGGNEDSVLDAFGLPKKGGTAPQQQGKQAETIKLLNKIIDFNIKQGWTKDTPEARGQNLNRLLESLEKRPQLIDEWLKHRGIKKDPPRLEDLPNYKGAGAAGPAGEPARGELLVNIAPQQVVLNIPELQKMTNDALTKIAMKKISVVFRDFAEELQGARDVSDIYTAVLASVEQHEGTDQVLGESADMSAMA